MFIIKSEKLKSVVGEVSGAYRHALIKDTCITVTASKESQSVSLSFVSDEIALQKKFSADVTNDITFNTSMMELQLKVSILPDEVSITVSPLKEHFTLRWGRGNGIVLRQQTVEDLRPFKVPEKKETISFIPGQWDHFTRYFTPFCSKRGDDTAKRLPITLGVNFKRVQKVGLVVSATNSSKIIQNNFDLGWFPAEVTIARDTFHVVSSVISSKDILELSLDEKRHSIIIESSTATVVARLLDGEYPNVEKFLGNDEGEVIWRTDRMELLEVARRIKRLDSKECIINIFKSDSKYYATLKGVLTEQIGSVIETVAEADMRLDANCLEAALTVLRSEEVLISLSKEETSPVTIFSGDPEEDGESNNLKVVLGQVKNI